VKASSVVTLTQKTFDDPLTDQDIVNLFMGLVRLVKRQYQTQIDALKEDIKILEIKLAQQQAQ